MYKKFLDLLIVSKKNDLPSSQRNGDIQYYIFRLETWKEQAEV